MRTLDGREQFYQWDLNQKITSNRFSVGEEIHFYNIKQPTALVVLAYELNENVVADVPNIILQSSQPFTAYRYITSDDGSYTIEEKQFKVIQRAKPSDYVYTETEVATIEKLVENEIQEAINSGDFKGEPGEKGEKGDPGKDGKDGKDGVDGKNGENYILTESDKQEIADIVINTLPTWTGGSY